MRELAKKHEFVAESTAVSSTAFTTCTAAPKPARWNTTVMGEAATSESVSNHDRQPFLDTDTLSSMETYSRRR